MKKTFNLLIISLIFPVLLFGQNVKMPDNLDSAIRKGEFETVKEMIQNDKSLINSVNHLNSTPLILAAFENQPEICEFLIDNGADLNLLSRNGSSAIHFAALKGNLNLTKKLCEKGAKVNVWNNRGRNPIHYATISGNIELFEYLESKGLDMTPATTDGATMLHWACYGGNIDMVKYLLNRDFNVDVVDANGYSVLHWAANRNSIEMLKYLVEEKEMDIRTQDPTGIGVIQYAGYARNVDGMKYFLSKGYGINELTENGQTVLMMASRMGDVDFVNYLIDNGADVNAVDKGGNAALNLAAFDGNVEIVASLLDKGALLVPKVCKESACAESPTALHDAAWGSPNVVEYFIKRGVDVNILDNNQKTALHNAMRRDSIKNIKLLCEAKINLNQQDKNGLTAIHYGARYNNAEGSKMLLKYNPNLNIKDKTGKTALHYACAIGNPEIIELLIKNNANINEKDNDGNSPLDLANYYGNNKSTKTMELNGAKSYNKEKNLFEKELAVGESAIWYLDHSGYAVKTKNNLLIFDYWERQPRPENGNLNNGYINPEDIKDLNVIVFVSHTHGDHFSQVIFDWKNEIKNINYVLGFEHNTDVNYTFIPARESKMVSNVKITPVVSNDSGQGFYVEVDGVTIFHPGDHSNVSQDMCPNYTGDVKFLADLYNHTDIAFFPVTGCRFRDKVALNMGTEFALEKMKPVLALPMHGSGNEYEYMNVSEDFNKKFEKEIFQYPLIRGDRFFYNNTAVSVSK